MCHSSLDFSQGKYRKWAKAAGFQSKLPGDVKKRKAAAELQTRTLDRYLGEEKKTAEPVERYTDKDFDKDFLQAAIEWLVVTGQVRYSNIGCFHPTSSV